MKMQRFSEQLPLSRDKFQILEKKIKVITVDYQKKINQYRLKETLEARF
jgi:hypothetical protein